MATVMRALMRTAMDVTGLISTGTPGACWLFAPRVSTPRACPAGLHQGRCRHQGGGFTGTGPLQHKQMPFDHWAMLQCCISSTLRDTHANDTAGATCCRFAFRRDGYNALGYTEKGQHKDGYKTGYDKWGFDAEGYNKEGFNRYG